MCFLLVPINKGLKVGTANPCAHFLDAPLQECLSMEYLQRLRARYMWRGTPNKENGRDRLFSYENRPHPYGV
jgi:hypothetical protein